MNYKIYFTAVLVSLMGVSFVQGQTRSKATDQGAMLVSGMFSFSNQGGDLYSFHDKRVSTIAIMPSLFHFGYPGIGIGGDISYNRSSYGDHSFTTWGAGPKIGYFIDSGNNTIPFLAEGVNYLSMGDGNDTDNGFRFKFGCGILIRKDHLAVSFEAAYVIELFKFEGYSEPTTGNTIAISIGFGGFLYQ